MNTADPASAPARTLSKHPRFIRYLQDMDAVGEVNRYFFWREHGWSPSIEEAIEHYRKNGGPEAFMQAHPELG